jgi:hypothetical protein
MDETKIDREMMGKLAKALAFIKSPTDPTVLALKTAAETGTEKDVKQARALLLRLKPQDRRAALTMLGD